MFGLFKLVLLLLLGLAAVYWWQSGVYKGRARDFASEHCRRLDLQLLDYSMVITGIWPVRGRDGRLALRRRYQFEFASLGDRRYQGELVLLGSELYSIKLETYKLPSGE
ncbi:MAG: DUF3301 domain-containing protein [Gammaproteobacteria bacterium]|jgi:hypothetical protein